MNNNNNGNINCFNSYNSDLKGMFTDFTWVVHVIVSSSEILYAFFIFLATNFMVSQIGRIAPLQLLVDY